MRTMTLSTVFPVALAVTLAVVVAACGSTGKERVTVLAASSLTAVFEDLETAYEEQNADVDLVISSGGSPSLAAQAAEGAPAALLITADSASMQRAIAADSVDGDPAPIATNTVIIAVPSDNPGRRVARPEDLADPAYLVSLCDPEVPCGSAAVDLLAAVGVQVEPDSLESSVQSVVSRLRLGEVDVGIVYRTDVTGADGDLRAVADDVPDEVGSVRYLAAALTAEPGGPDVLEFLLGPEGRRILTDHGFGPP